MAETRRCGDVPDLAIAQRFELVDHEGRVRAVLGDASGEAEDWFPGFSLLDEQGCLRVTLLASLGGMALTFFAKRTVVPRWGSVSLQKQSGPARTLRSATRSEVPLGRCGLSQTVRCASVSREEA